MFKFRKPGNKPMQDFIDWLSTGMDQYDLEFKDDNMVFHATKVINATETLYITLEIHTAVREQAK